MIETLCFAVGFALCVRSLDGAFDVAQERRAPGPVLASAPPEGHRPPQLHAAPGPALRVWSVEQLRPATEPRPTPPGYGGVRTVGGYSAESEHPEYRTTPWVLPDDWDELVRERAPAIGVCSERFSMGETLGTWTALVFPERKALAIPTVFITPEDAARMGLDEEALRRANAWGVCVTWELSSALVADGAPRELKVRLPLPLPFTEHERRRSVEIPAAWRNDRNDPDGDGRAWRP